MHSSNADLHQLSDLELLQTDLVRLGFYHLSSLESKGSHVIQQDVSKIRQPYPELIRTQLNKVIR